MLRLHQFGCLTSCGDSTFDPFTVTNRSSGPKGLTISGASNSSSERNAAVSLLFSGGTRPSADDIHSLVEGGFSVVFDPGGGSGREDGTGEAPVWLELLASGLSFDLTGLAPGVSADRPPHLRSLALGEVELDTLEAVTLVPGPHLAGGRGLMPIVGALAALGASLSCLKGVRAVAWHPSGCWSEPGVYRDGVRRWTEGGVFPALTLTSLLMTPDGGMQSEGLSLFNGQELRLEPDMIADQAEAAKLAIRLLDYLVERGRIAASETFVGPDGTPLRLEPSPDNGLVRICRS